MANPEKIKDAFAAAVDSASLDPDAQRVPRDERIAFDAAVLNDAMRLLVGPADRERAVAALDVLMHEAIDQLDMRRGLASLKLLEKLDAAGQRRVYREGEGGLEPLS